MNANVLCIIPARGGSKRIPRKNALCIAGKPLVAHSIEQAKRSQHVRKVIVSTDDSEIAEISERFGAEVIRRPESISQDESSSEEALKHALSEVEKSGFQADLVVFLQCTSPVRDDGDIDRALETFWKEQSDSLFSVCRNDRFLWRKVDGEMKSLNYDYRQRHRDQDHPEEYRENGSIYVFKPSILRQYNNRLGGKIAIYKMDYWESFQVDSEEHLALCEWILEQRKKKSALSQLPQKPRLIVSDFDGVMTDNKVLVTQDGLESVFCHRGDGWGVDLLKKKGIRVVVLSTEGNPVVKARCEKLAIPYHQNSKNKLETLKRIAKEFDVPLGEIIYIGNDTNDLDCLLHVGCGVAVADSHPDILKVAKIVLSAKGGEGALRELSSLVLEQWERWDRMEDAVGPKSGTTL